MRNMRFAIIGSGMAGILAAIELRKAGHDDVTVFEKADRLGGTWRENTYPGIACDVPSYVYSYSFEPNPDWSRRFSPGDEIQRYFEGVAERYGITPLVRFSEEVTALEWRDGAWDLHTVQGATERFDVVIAATGVLHHPNVPHFEGIETFRGAAFHSAQWDHDVPLDGKRVGVIGTGSTAVQIATALIPRAERFTLFQRTAQWVIRVDNPEVSDAEKERYRNDPAKLEAVRAQLASAFRDAFSAAVIDADSPGIKAVEDQCRRNLEDTVVDPVLREKLRPDYRAACKRLIASPDFYEKIQEPNAVLVTDAIERIEPDGVRTADGTLHELDVLVLATGFKPDRFVRPTRVTGVDGVDLDDAWRTRPTAYLSVSVPGFPNLFLLNGPNGPVGNFSLIEVAEMQMAYVMQLVDVLAADRARAIAATAEATAALEAERREAAMRTIWVTGCRSWYLDDEGIPASWTFTFERFVDEMRAPKLEHYTLSS